MEIVWTGNIKTNQRVLEQTGYFQRKQRMFFQRSHFLPSAKDLLRSFLSHFTASSLKKFYTIAGDDDAIDRWMG